MKKYFLIPMIALVFFGCTAKKTTLNEELDSFSLSKDIYVSKVPQKVDSNFKIGLNTGTYLKHVGINIGTVYIPKITNNDGIDLDAAINKYNLNLESLVFKAFNRNFKKDEHYKNYYVTFGGKYSMNIDIVSYRLNSSLFSDLYQVKFELKVVIKDELNKIVYDNTFFTNSLEEEKLYFRNEILSSEELLEKSLNYSLDNVISKVIQDMKKN
ncbi:MAG: hypothetical protein ABF301_06335 [Sulfurovum sp.]|jgi:hypothetical protein